MLASARRPSFLRRRRNRSREELVALAQRLEARWPTLKAKDRFRDQPANMGLFGTLGTPLAYEAIGTADCIAAFGAS